MSSTREPGFRLIYPREGREGKTQSASLAYVIDHGSAGGHEYTVITEQLSKRISQDAFRTDIKPRSQGVDFPSDWGDTAWEEWCRMSAEGVQRVLSQIQTKMKEAHHE